MIQLLTPSIASPISQQGNVSEDEKACLLLNSQKLSALVRAAIRALVTGTRLQQYSVERCLSNSSPEAQRSKSGPNLHKRLYCKLENTFVI